MPADATDGPPAMNGSAALPADLAAESEAHSAALNIDSPPPIEATAAAAAAGVAEAAGTSPKRATGLPPRHPPSKGEAAAAAQQAQPGQAGEAAEQVGAAEKQAGQSGQPALGSAAPGSSGQAGRSPRASAPSALQSDQPLTFTSPVAAACELRNGGTAQQQAGADGEAVQGDERRPGGVLRSSTSGADPPRPRRTVSWSDFQNQAPLAQVVEYEPSEGRSARSEEEWSNQSGCVCCIQ